MAAFGAKHLLFAPITEERKGELPTYDGTKAVQLGMLVKADLSVNYSSGELYADNVLAERVEEFASGTIAAEVDEMEDEVAHTVYGSRITESQEIVENSENNVPFGGLGYYKTLMKNGVKFFRAYFYPKVKAAIGNDSAATKGSSITLSTTPITFTVFEPENGDWRYTKRFNREADAVAYIEGKLGKQAAQDSGESQGSGGTQGEET